MKETNSRGFPGATKNAGESANHNGKALAGVSREFRIPISRAKIVGSPYDVDRGEDKICNGLPCQLNQDQAFLNRNMDRFKEESCLGYCDNAPVYRVDGRYSTRTRSGFVEIRESTEDFIYRRREGISQYLVRGGYSALELILGMSDYSGIIEQIEKSGLKGMGGAGFPVVKKWKSMPRDRGSDSNLLVNCHEGEPGTFKDRTILELTPHDVIEGAVVTAIINGLGNIVIAIRADFRNAIQSLESALKEFLKRYETASKRVPILIVSVRGGYVAGEETALMEVIEGKRGEPRLRPPFPTEVGLYGKPTLVHNAETLSMIPQIIVPRSNGISKSFCLTGDVAEPGNYRAALGITAEELLHDLGGSGKGDLKAFLPGGLSGSIFPLSSLGMKLDHDSVREAGGGLGTGAFIGISKERCMVDITGRIMKFFEHESCGKCVPCRLGTKELSGIIHRLRTGQGTMEDLESGKKTASAMIDGSICALGQAAGKTFSDVLERFGEEIVSHTHSKCPEGVCRMVLS